ncbi:Pyrophosphate--fructose 6-phosphate 1-phosphotransferase [Bacteroides pyogenes]|uniref:Pyrophosphate--fructose 6-phosphate 1-phosphotransferase n=2 Tax=Bacteroides pyogenes TaxID=310300 RepID=A0A5D3EU97_9BACE|nr:diphosphate--fructose-6-phosphate 1-phosphotransferase [Bacteroides pyogenes]MBR8709218.1 Pyrophosphate--fructose 6-phosphate 1-phosphotransferase [Bacteroides pyogenes]MBR8718032.1 Pyrophosphate--fructose 6-phosphate 1-phosphotransferase [Bacteroides pyogenes]MBR8720798.1 Pyrophosphate--fructose 6-phosphate 1-phosphotransferase [Bacteroides pyogenes]MBR8724265.1 Pyrophosphate--fructose 6-phosphate 1-phosphotransferase [Bacteroides pyogenes]MBR8739613.1 Pyrophosphate--fructose 6-phosphate 1
MTKSALQIARAAYQPKLPKALASGNVKAVAGAATQSVADQEAIKALFPNTYGMPLISFEAGESTKPAAMNVGVILSGGQAPGGHNVISGLFDGIKKLNADNKLYGFILGPGGLVDHNYMELTADIIDEYRNTGGFDIIGSGRTKLETVEQFEKGYEIIKQLGIKALVIIGGDDSNTNACVLAEYYAAKKYGVQVIGCPKTIDGDLKNDMIETSFGFDTACKTYSEVIGNIQRDCNSARKYWHFIKLMGRSASHIALECALQVQPNVCIISEEVEQKDMSLDDVVTYIAQVVADRAAQGNNFGTVLIPEGLVEFIPAMKRLIAELNDFLAKNSEEFSHIKRSHQRDYIISKLSPENSAIYASLPDGVARQLTLDRDPHGNVQVSLIETEKLLSEMVATKLDSWKKAGKYVGKFAAQHHFFGYEGRCAAPSNFDADYCYSLGYTASMLIADGKTGYMSSVRNTTAPAAEWLAGGVPITMMMNMERRHGEMKPVIQKALVRLDGAPFKAFAAQRDRWAAETDYVYPGPIQYFGPTEVCDQPTKTLQLEQAK